MPIYSVAFLCYVYLVVEDPFFSCSSSLAAHIFVDVLDFIKLQLERANDGGTEVTERTRNNRITRDHIVYGNCCEMRSVRFAYEKLRPARVLLDSEIADDGGNVVENEWKL
ncbi:hypothetical protein N7516_011090 [Penicillium verrucosum]|uniref:uncharacterized protein n=1 Tax=Penicillium verrucosum TaxID=60171 RepID=UPI0025456EDD|nr:uncharacterized protein N7516_011090 [Penicillium verrucosum]KAJ5920232.1 hypothetical protein N7516_011090 [Penicillium verrucosum]